jgi:hypothetical protein
VSQSWVKDALLAQDPVIQLRQITFTSSPINNELPVEKEE